MSMIESQWFLHALQMEKLQPCIIPKPTNARSSLNLHVNKQNVYYPHSINNKSIV